MPRDSSTLVDQRTAVALQVVLRKWHAEHSDRAAFDAERAAADPAWFCRDVLGSEPYDRQIEMIESVRDNEQTSCVGANASGKDWMAGRIAAWYLATHRPAKVIITGPTSRQVTDIVWREVRMAYHDAKVPLGGRMMPTDARWEVDDDRFALGFSTDKPWGLQGFHSPNLLVIVTEAHAFSDADLVAIKRLLPNRLLLTGNPFSASGEFFDSHHAKRHLYNPIAISAFDSPNVKAGQDLIPGLVTQRDIDRFAEDWGEDSPLYQATVFGEFGLSEDGLIPLPLLMAAKARPLAEDTREQIVGGLDVAGPGEDETSLTLRQGPNILFQKSWAQADPRGEVLAELQRWGPRVGLVSVDSAGIGYYLGLHLQDNGIPTRLVNVGESPRNGERYANLKAELYWGLRQRFQAGDVAGLTDEKAISQLAGIRYGHDARGRVVIESKDVARKRGVKSPDRAEGIMLAFSADAPDPGDGQEAGEDAQRAALPQFANLMGRRF